MAWYGPADHESRPFLGNQLRDEEEIKQWDVFEDPPIKKNSGSMEESKIIDFVTKIFKVVTYIICFTVVLGAGVISKGTLLFMTSQIANQTKPFCNKNFDINKQFEIALPRVERLAWMWILVFTFYVPELGTFIRSVRICLFKTWKYPAIKDFLSVFVTESLPTIGSAILVFCILPKLDVVKGAMLTNAVCFVPAVVGFFSRNPKEDCNVLKMILDGASIGAQVTSFVVWPLVENKSDMWLIPLAVILISCGWWENYVSEESYINIIKHLGKVKKSFQNSRYFTYAFISLWKCFLFLMSFLVIVAAQEGDVNFLFNNFTIAFQEHYVNVTEVRPIIGDKNAFDINEVIDSGGTTRYLANNLTPVWVFLINVLASYICYAFGKWACKIVIQPFGYAFPINLTIPVTISFLIAACGLFNADECSFINTVPPYLFFNSPPIYFLKDFIGNEHSWVWLLWLLSQTWITIHMWSPHCENLARTERLFVRPMYDAYLIDQSLAMNRRRDDMPEREDEEENDSDDDELDNISKVTKTINGSEITRIYACGTMWHETKEEMMEFLKSVMRLDEDQCARRLVKDELGFLRDDYYEIEIHIFFDDAFVRQHKDDNDPTVNEYVKTLALAMDDAASEVHQTRIRIRPPKKYMTPYGGRLVWTLPGKTMLYAHLKDRKKIRPKKRWSQVMYMYYLLGHRLMAQDETARRKDTIAENTYILALDGDIDFQPDAVHLLVDLMKKNKTLGAACGRIHPIGSGPMVWYQMFEYAIGHWLQKATEHMIGCVLCSPGCFSLFKAKALMDDGVMRKYTTKSEEARHFVQYDQGEDRWLCTLLLQRGYRVEYSAASDAFTHCPESFNEFYNQRRRWMPSTTANILDLLMDAKRTIKINDNISRLYIGYQILLMIGTVLGPGTIFLMLVGAFVAAFQLDQWTSFLWNVIPILIFMIVCVLFKSDVQLFFAGVISAMYGLVMMAVLVGVMLQISVDGFFAPSSLFFFCVAGEMIVTALLHPKEVGCLLYGIVYYVTVPSMYMLLIIYSVFNLNNISWGTREFTISPKVNENKQQEKQPKQDLQTKEKIISIFGKSDDKAGSLEFSVPGLFKCMLCTHKNDGPENIQLLQISDDLRKLSEKLDNMEKVLREEDVVDSMTAPARRRTTMLQGSNAVEVIHQLETPSESDRKSPVSDGIDGISWLDEEDLGHGEYDCLSTNEKLFWEDILEKYLHPIEDNKEKVTKDLKDLRDKAVMAFFMVNALFVLVIFLLTLKKDMLHVSWPLDVKVNFTYIDIDGIGEIFIYKQYLELEPIGFVFLLFFASLLCIQFTAMLFHRFGTFSQIMTATYVSFDFLTPRSRRHLTDEELLYNDPVKIVKQWMKLKGADDGDREEETAKEEPSVGRRKTVMRIADGGGQKRHSVNDLTEAFERRITKMYNKNLQGNLPRKSMAAAINKRRSTVHHARTSVRFNLPYDDDSEHGFVNESFEPEVKNT